MGKQRGPQRLPRTVRCEPLEQRTLLDGVGLLPPFLAGTIASADDVHTTDVQLTGGSTLTVNPVQGRTADRALAPRVALYTSTGELLSATNDGHPLQIVVPATADYQLRVSGDNERRVRTVALDVRRLPVCASPHVA